MRVLVVGGSGYVAGLFLPALAARHPTRILDRRPPPDGPAEVEYLAGDATDHADLRRASAGMDAVVHCAMGSTAWRTPAGAADAFDVNVKSVHLTLLAARSNGVPHAVYISSMSVYRRLTARRLDESVPPDATVKSPASPAAAISPPESTVMEPLTCANPTVPDDKVALPPTAISTKSPSPTAAATTKTACQPPL